MSADCLHFQGQQLIVYILKVSWCTEWHILEWTEHKLTWQLNMKGILWLCPATFCLYFHHSYLLLTLEKAIFISSCVHRPWRVGRAWACYHTFWQPKKLEKIQDSIAFINKTKTCLKCFFTNPFSEFFGKINFQIWIGFCDLKVV